MKTHKIPVNNSGHGLENALNEVEGFSRSMGFDEKSALRARLLAEETMSMVKSIVGDFEADFWMESSEAWNCELHLLATADMDYEKKRNLVAASTRERNEASPGIMGKIKDFIEGSLFYMAKGKAMPVGQGYIIGSANYAELYSWSLERYREDLEQGDEEDEEMYGLLDELEKSIVANIADDVQVSVKGNQIEMIIRKNFS